MRFVDLHEIGQQALMPPEISDKGFSDLVEFVVTKEFIWQIGKSKGKIPIPMGFVTDYASIPSWALSFGFPKRGPYDRAAAIHDYLYWAQKCTRKQADNLMLIAMKESPEVPPLKRTLIYLMVRSFGCFAWRGNAALKKKGFIKIVPEAKIAEIGVKTTWKRMRDQLFHANVPEPAWEDRGEYAKYGDTTKVPVE